MPFSIPRDPEERRRMTDESDEGERRLGELEIREMDGEAAPLQVVRRGDTFEAFRYRDYSLFWSGALISNIGTWMQAAVLSIVVYSFRGSELDLGLVQFVAGIPTLFLAVPAGAIADRFNRRLLVSMAQAALMVQAAAFAVLYGTGRLSPEHAIEGLAWVAGLGLIGGVLTALTFPAWQAMLPDLVPKPTLLNAIALNSAQFQSARMLGPLAASGLLLLGASIGGIFWVNAVSFLFVIGAVLIVRLRYAVPHPPRPREPAWATLTAGVRYARENRVVGLLIVSTAILTVFGMPYMMLVPAVADKALGFPHGTTMNARVATYLMAANGFGAVFGALVVASLPKTVRRESLLRFTLLATALMLIAYSFSRSIYLSLLFSALAGAAVLSTNSLVNTSIQSTAPPHLRGRVVALFIMAFLGIMPISAVVFGPLGQAVGPTNAILGGACVLLVWSLVLIVRPKLLLTDAQIAQDAGAA
jgi:MFS family permease